MRKAAKVLTAGGAIALGVVVVAWLMAQGGSAAERGDLPPAHDVVAEEVTRLAASMPGARLREPASADRAPSSVPAPRPAWILTGRVSEPSGGPVAGAEVELRCGPSGGSSRRLALTHTGADGGYTCGLPELDSIPPLQRVTSWLHARARAAGHHPAVAALELPVLEPPPEPLRLDLVMEPGAVLRGRVVDPEGAGVADATVQIGIAGKNAGSTRTDAGGAYELGFRESGTHHVWADTAGEGSGQLRPLHLDAASDALAPDLVLTGSQIAGIVVHPDGIPIPDLGLEAECRHHSGTPEHGVASRGATRTDAHGRFRFRGLARGKYEIVPTGTPVFRRRSADLPLFLAGDLQARVVIDLVVIRVGVRDSEGRALLGLRVLCRGWNAEPPGTTLSRREDVPPPGALQRTDHSSWLDLVEEGASASVLAPPGSVWFLTACAKGAIPATAWVRVPQDAAEMRADLVLRALDRPACLRVDVRDEAGKPLTDFTWSAVSDRLRTAGEAMPGPCGRDSKLLAEDRYHIVVSPGPRRLSTFLPVLVEDIELTSGRERVIPIVARQGGRVRMTARFPAEALKPTFEPELDAWPAGGGAPISMRPFHVLQGSEWTQASGCESGVPFLADKLLEPGRYVLLLMAEGYARKRFETVIEPGKVSDVELWLEPAGPARKR